MINLSHISFKYPVKGRFSLEDITLAISPGQIFTLLGPNGAGKTTLIRILAGLIIPEKGTAAICGHDVLIQEYAARRSIGLVLGDERTFYFRLSGAQNLEFFGGLYGLPRRELKEKIAISLALVGLEKDAGLQYMRYSSGMKKRLALARALLHVPQVYLLDEPNSGVDPLSARNIREIIFDLKKQGKTILLTTHNMAEAEKMSDRIGFLREGKLIKEGTLDEFKNLIGRKWFRLELAIGDNAAGIERFAGIIKQIENLPGCFKVQTEDSAIVVEHNGHFEIARLLNLANQDRLPILRAETREATLEDIFIRLAG